MSEVKRYEMIGQGDCEMSRVGDSIEEGPHDAQYVLASDFDRIAARLAEAERIRNPQYIDEKMRDRFTSGNSVPVERAHVTRIEWDSWLTRLATAEARVAEFESVGWQYKFPSIWGGVVWRDSQSDHNGSKCIEAREIFARRAGHSAGAVQEPVRELVTCRCAQNPTCPLCGGDGSYIRTKEPQP